MEEGTPIVRREFLTTQWSVVLQARNPRASQAAGALEALCRSYWLPLYAHVRRQGMSPADAQDLTQAFFERLLERKTLELADQERGRFRSFLLASLRHFMADERDRVNAWKRGGRVQHVPLDSTAAENVLEEEGMAKGPEESGYDRAWAWAVMERVRQRLRGESDQNGKRELFDALHPESGSATESYESIGGRLGMSEGAVKLAAFRLRQRYRDLIREEVAQTVADPGELEDEIRHLLRVLGG